MNPHSRYYTPDRPSTRELLLEQEIKFLKEQLKKKKKK